MARRDICSRANLVFNTGVLSFSVLANENGIDVIVRRLESLDRGTGANVGKKLEGAAKCQVQRDVSLANYQGQRASAPGGYTEMYHTY
jgi:hypothetical protein